MQIDNRRSAIDNGAGTKPRLVHRQSYYTLEWI